MPPKRKQVDNTVMGATTSTRSTRQATRAAAGTKKTNAQGSTTIKAASDGLGDEDAAEPVPAKKARTAAAKKTAGKGGRKKAGQDETDPPTPSKPLPPVESPTVPRITNFVLPEAPAKRTASSIKSANLEVYTAQRALDLFNSYVDEDVPDVIGPEGFEKLCTDASMPMEGARPLIFAWQLQVEEMGKISKQEWVQGMATLRIASVAAISIAMAEFDELLLNGKKSTTLGKEYDRTAYNNYASNPKAAFQKLYMYSFNLVKPEQSKNIDMETSLAFWTVLLVPKFPLMKEIVDFIKDKQGTYKATNKDLWSMMLEFCETVKPSLQDYEADGAWPTLLDDFVSWKLSCLGNTNDNRRQMDASEH